MAYAEDDPEGIVRVAKFRQELERLGWSEGRNVRIDYRFTAARADQFQVLAKELVALHPDVILAHATRTPPRCSRRTRAIPIVFVNVSDPIGAGFVTSLARPGGNLTGVLHYEASIAGKWLAMLKEISPRLARAALVGNPKVMLTGYDYFLRAAEATAPSFAIELVPSHVENAADIERAIESFARVPNGGLVLPPDSTTNVHRDLVIATRGPAPLASDLHGPFVCYSRWSHVLWDRPGRNVWADGDLYRPHPARRQARRPSGTGADQVRNCA